jgi:diacylglycerol kinase family enzyme
MKITVVYNAQSGSAYSKRKLVKLFKQAGIDVDKYILVNDNLTETLKPYVKKGHIIAAIGGDGTIGRVAGLVALSEAILLPLPGGTLNHFTKDLGVIQNLEKAILAVAQGKIEQIDVASVNNIFFINNSSIGLYPSTLTRRNKYEEFIGKWPAATLSMVKVLIRWPTVTITVAGKTFRTPFIFIGNNSYSLTEIGLPARHSLKSGTLGVFIANTTSRRALLKVGLMSLLGQSRFSEQFETHYVQKLTIQAKRARLRIARDGELEVLSSPLTYQCHSRAISVWVVRPSVSSRTKLVHRRA